MLRDLIRTWLLGKPIVKGEVPKPFYLIKRPVILDTLPDEGRVHIALKEGNVYIQFIPEKTRVKVTGREGRKTEEEKLKSYEMKNLPDMFEANRRAMEKKSLKNVPFILARPLFRHNNLVFLFERDMTTQMYEDLKEIEHDCTTRR